MANSKSTRAKQISDSEAQKLLRNFKKRPALLRKKEVFDLDKVIRGDGFGVTRRIALLMLTKTGANLINSVAKDRELLLQLLTFTIRCSSTLMRLRICLAWWKRPEGAP